MTMEPTWADILTAASATAAVPLVLIAIRQLRDSAQTRHAQLMLELTRRWDETPILDSRKLWSRKTTEEIEKVVLDAFDKSSEGFNSEEYHKLSLLASYFETMGALHGKTTAIPLSLLDALWGAVMPDAWGRLQPAAYALRTKLLEAELATGIRYKDAVESIPAIWGNFEELVRKLEKLEAARRAALWRRVWYRLQTSLRPRVSLLG